MSDMRHLLNITEGLIKVPEPVVTKCMSFLRRVVLHRIRDNMTPEVRKKYPKHFAEFRAAVKKYDLKFPREKCSAFRVIDAMLTPDMLPGYPDFKPEELLFAVNIADKSMSTADTVAQYKPRMAAILVDMMVGHNRHILNYPMGNVDPDLESWFAQMQEQIEHEIRHAVQHLVIRHPDQTKIKKDYSTDRNKAYMLSPVEFDPQIGSAVENFIALWKVMAEHNQQGNFKDRVLTFTAQKKPKDMFSPFSPQQIFKALKAHAPNRYRIAVKKFYVELMNRFEAMKPRPEG